MVMLAIDAIALALQGVGFNDFEFGNWMPPAWTGNAVEKISIGGRLAASIMSTIVDILPIAGVILFFQMVVLRRPLANPQRLFLGFFFVLLGLSFFLVGLDVALFPLGSEMARQLTEPEFLGTAWDNEQNPSVDWRMFYWTYLFAFSIGFSATIAEPALIAVAMKAEEVSGGALRAKNLRWAVAVGVGVGITLGVFRIIAGHSLPAYIVTAYLFVVVQTWFAPKSIIPLAYDSGGVTTSTITVPIITALGLGLSSQIPGRNVLIDGFGLIAFACLFPIISVMGYAQIGQWLNQRQRKPAKQSVSSTATVPSTEEQAQTSLAERPLKEKLEPDDPAQDSPN